MKRFVLCLSIIMFSAFAMFAEDAVTETTYYKVSYPAGVSAVANLDSILDGYFTYFNSVFRFDRAGPGFKYLVRIFSSKNDFNAYVREKTGTNRDPQSDTVFLRYETKENSELAVLKSSVSSSSFIRQLFVQYIYGFATEVPAWVLAGFPLMFEHSEWKSGKVSNRVGENPWLEPAKVIARDSSKGLTVMKMLSADRNTYSLDVFMPQAYLLARFFTEAPFAECNRLFSDGIFLIKTGATGDTFLSYQREWLPVNKLEAAYREYLGSLRNVREVTSEGITLYAQGDTDSAIARFREVLDMDDSNSVAMYYIGLCMYAQQRYADADIWYNRALNVDPGQNYAYIYWGLATSAIADKRFEEAIPHLENAKSSDAANFTERVDELLEQIQ